MIQWHALQRKLEILRQGCLFCICLVFMAVGASSSGLAQTPDPETIRRAIEQRQQLEGQSQQRRSPLDAARERRRLEEDRSQEGPRTRQVREAEPEPLSQIEADYNARLGRRLKTEAEREEERLMAIEAVRERSREASRSQRLEDRLRRDEPEVLRQFGYDIFRPEVVSEPRGSALTGRLPPDYVLGIGDEVVVSLVGSTNRTITTEVDREGRVVLPELPPISAAGRTFEAFRSNVRQTVSETLLGTEAFVSIANLRQISVAVLGEVARPGLYELTSLSDVLQLLNEAGGVEKTGSLRGILVISGGDRRLIDLYRLMRGDLDVDLRLSDGDRVVVPIIGETVAVAGNVVRPAIYELPPQADNLRVADVLEMAGGTLRPRGLVIQRDRIDEEGRQRLQAVKAESAAEINDIYEIRPARDIKAARVRLEGHVRQPGSLPLDAAPTLSALLLEGEALEPDPYLSFAVLETTDLQSLQRVYRPIKLGPTLAGAEDIRLKDQDRLIVLGASDIDYLSSPAVRSAVLAPESINENACQAVQELARRARQADTERLAAAARSVFVAGQLEGAVSAGQSESAQAQQTAEDASANEVITQTEIVRQARARQACNELFEEYPPLLPLAIEYSVAAIGAVREPGLYPVANETTLRDIVAASGGLTLSADPSRVEISSFRSTPGMDERARRRYVDLTSKSLAQVEVSSASAVRFGAQQARMESGTVLLSGEFQHPGVYTIDKGETLLSVIDRAGGLTDQAFPFGAVFTRVRVKQEQEESFRRTARELNNALALAVLKENVSGDGLQAATSLVQNLSAVEAAGRVVVEANPAVLRANPERDIVLEGGDSVFMPSRPNFVLTAGDLLNPGALQFDPGKGVESYLAEAGGFQETADDGRVFVVLPNGVARPVTLSLWTTPDIDIPPGSTIVVPKDVNPLETLNIVREITNVLSNLAISAASIAVIGDN